MNHDFSILTDAFASLASVWIRPWEDGIASEATRKKISKDDAANDDVDAALFEVFGTKQRIRIGKILKDHGLYAPHNMANDLQYVITLPAAEEIMNAQGGEKVDGYTLENIELEYESIDNIGLARKVESQYNVGRKLYFEHVILMKKTEWSKDSPLSTKRSTCHAEA
jgi:hypothetical protein